MARDHRAREARQEQRRQAGRRKAGARRPSFFRGFEVPLAVRIRIESAHSLELTPFCQARSASASSSSSTSKSSSATASSAEGTESVKRRRKGPGSASASSPSVPSAQGRRRQRPEMVRSMINFFPAPPARFGPRPRAAASLSCSIAFSLSLRISLSLPLSCFLSVRLSQLSEPESLSRLLRVTRLLEHSLTRSLARSLALAALQDGPAGEASTGCHVTGGGDASAKRGRRDGVSDTSSIYTESQA